MRRRSKKARNSRSSSSSRRRAAWRDAFRSRFALVASHLIFFLGANAVTNTYATELSLDHVIPISRGGKSTWENVVCACLSCNVRKGNKLLHESGINLIRGTRAVPMLVVVSADYPTKSLAELIEKAKTEMMQVKGEGIATDEICENCKSPMVIKFGRFGEFLACSNYPECKFTKDMSGGRERPADQPTDEI